METLINNKFPDNATKFRIEGRNDFVNKAIIIQSWFRKQLMRKKLKDNEERIRTICIKMFEENAIIIQRFYRNYKIQKEINLVLDNLTY